MPASTISLTDAQLESAIDVFAAGFAMTKSRTWPYEVVRIGGVRVLRDVERRNPKDYRKEEWIVQDTPPSRVDTLARKHTRGRFFVCPIIRPEESAEELKAAWKSLGYRLLSTEPMFVHTLRRIPKCMAVVDIRLVRSPEDVAEFAKVTRMRPEPAEVLTDDAYRQYIAVRDDRIVGWVRSIETPSGNWCTNMVVKPEFRRQGIGRALLTRMLRDDRERGAAQCVLLASHTGALLYPHVGYQQCGLLFIFVPLRG
jgi:GNAT superfamily N-acetyltransferase